MNNLREELSEKDKEPMKVYYGMNFWGSCEAAKRTSKKAKELQKIMLDRAFGWDDISGLIPAIYVGMEGMAVDLCIRVSNEAFQAFYDKWLPKMEGDLSRAEQEQAEAENPMNINFNLEISVNGKRLENDFACGTCYSKITKAEYKEDGVEEQLMKEYQCDDQSSWCFKRYMFKWEKQPEKIVDLDLKFIGCQKDYPGESIKIDIKCKGRQYELLHPLNNKQYSLCIKNMVQQKLSKEVLDGLKREGKRCDWEYPNQYLILTYTMEPEISQESFRLQDVSGVDGPTSIFIAGKKKDRKEMIAVSAMYFEPVTHVTLKPVFMEKEREDGLLHIHVEDE